MSHNTVSVCIYVSVCVCLYMCLQYSMLAVINYIPHAGDLLRLLITSQTKPTGGWFSYTNRESISVWGLVYLSTFTHVAVFARVCVLLPWSRYHHMSHCLRVRSTILVVTISHTWLVCWSFLSIGALMRRVFVLRTVSMVFQSSLLTVLEPSPLMKGEKHIVACPQIIQSTQTWQNTYY